MRKILTATALVLALGCTSFAGEIHNPKTQPAAPTTQETSADGIIQNGFTEAVLSLLSSAFALL
jgi:hypothetical protein